MSISVTNEGAACQHPIRLEIDRQINQTFTIRAAIELRNKLESAISDYQVEEACLPDRQQPRRGDMSHANTTGSMPPEIVNHGNVFGTGNWFTFYCPVCQSQITRGETEALGCKCGCAIDWATKENPQPQDKEK